MALAAFYDTETTGLPRADLAIYQREQPHLVQVAALLVDLDTRLVVSTLDVLVRPAGWTIPTTATGVATVTATSDEVCVAVNAKAGVKATDTADAGDTDAALVVVASDLGNFVYGCATASKEVSYKF